MRPLWDWAKELVQDPTLAPYFEWDAQRLSKYDGKRFERFIHEPWTADEFWDIQVCSTDISLYFIALFKAYSFKIITVKAFTRSKATLLYFIC